MAAKNSVKYPISAPTGRDSRFVLIGGFLGAGKTTAIARLARWLIVRGLRLGLITNDQGEGLVDTVSSIAATGGDSMPAVRQVTGGCFCCRAGELGQAPAGAGFSGASRCFYCGACGKLHGFGSNDFDSIIPHLSERVGPGSYGCAAGCQKSMGALFRNGPADNGWFQQGCPLHSSETDGGGGNSGHKQDSC